MNELNLNINSTKPLGTLNKFEHPDLTAKGERRATVALHRLATIWINTGTLCNIECNNCYIESSPKNDRLSFISTDEVCTIVDEIEQQNLGTEEVAFTGGEPFLNPYFLEILRHVLARGYRVLVLTNAMQPMQRKRVKSELTDLNRSFRNLLYVRVSLDHYTQELHERERGPRSWQKTVEGIDWLRQNNFNIAIAGRTCWGEDENGSRKGYADLIAEHNWQIDAFDPTKLILFPEMDVSVDVPEITTECWNILGVNPQDMMCASSRMVVKRKGEDHLTILPCTLLPYNKAFNMGKTLAESLKKNGGMFDNGSVKLCHHNCAKFCVLGGGSCTA
jgi:MoaA/NifB/PqqE/SkfB family radical SAM enzyme